jgi:hypothetical protein
MFFVLYALGLLVLGAGLVAGMALWVIGALYALAGCLVIGAMQAVKAIARRTGRVWDPHHRRRATPPIRA